jgi:hypothetical protein
MGRVRAQAGPALARDLDEMRGATGRPPPLLRIDARNVGSAHVAQSIIANDIAQHAPSSVSKNRQVISAQSEHLGERNRRQAQYS